MKSRKEVWKVIWSGSNRMQDGQENKERRNNAKENVKGHSKERKPERSVCATGEE
jgi:hypothetical protein